MMLFCFGRVPGCLARWQSVRSGFWGCEVWWFAGRGGAISAALDGCRG